MSLYSFKPKILLLTDGDHFLTWEGLALKSKKYLPPNPNYDQRNPLAEINTSSCCCTTWSCCLFTLGRVMCIFQSRKFTQYSEVQCLMRIPNQQLSNISDFGGTTALCNLLVYIYKGEWPPNPNLLASV